MVKMWAWHVCVGQPVARFAPKWNLATHNEIRKPHLMESLTQNSLSLRHCFFSFSSFFQAVFFYYFSLGFLVFNFVVVFFYMFSFVVVVVVWSQFVEATSFSMVVFLVFSFFLFFPKAKSLCIPGVSAHPSLENHLERRPTFIYTLTHTHSHTTLPRKGETLTLTFTHSLTVEKRALNDLKIPSTYCMLNRIPFQSQFQFPLHSCHTMPFSFILPHCSPFFSLFLSLFEYVRNRWGDLKVWINWMQTWNEINSQQFIRQLFICYSHYPSWVSECES